MSRPGLSGEGHPRCAATERVDLPSAVRVVLACTSGYRLPEPLRLAHRLAGEALRGEPGRPYRELAAGGANWRGESHG